MTESRDLSAAGAFVILGAAGGIGSAIARALATDGARLVLAGRSAEKLDALAAELHATAASVETATVEASDFAAVESLVAGASQRNGRVAGLVNAVGSILLKPAHMTSEADLAETLRLNVQTAFAAVRAAGKVMTDGGSVLLFASSASEVGLPNHEAIAAAKGAVGGLVRSAAATYAGRKLRVNALAPGLVDTPMAARITGNPKSLEVSVAMHPLGRIGGATDIAPAARWLLDPASDWVTGQVIAIDGGMSKVRSAR
jgi:NAD(P)-dependent dehydrogenase (short-subunit alcohol dehydrogenase family)